MGKKIERVSLSDADLGAKIDRIIEIRPMANEYKLLLGSVKEELLARGAETFTSAAGHTSTIERTPAFKWLIEKLQTALSRPVFYALCPRKPDTKKLNQRLAATPDDKRLAACRVPTGGETVEVSVFAKGETKAVNISAADEVEAAA